MLVVDVVLVSRVGAFWKVGEVDGDAVENLVLVWDGFEVQVWEPLGDVVPRDLPRVDVVGDTEDSGLEIGECSLPVTKKAGDSNSCILFDSHGFPGRGVAPLSPIQRATRIPIYVGIWRWNE